MWQNLRTYNRYFVRYSTPKRHDAIVIFYPLPPEVCASGEKASQQEDDDLEREIMNGESRRGRRGMEGVGVRPAGR